MEQEKEAVYLINDNKYLHLRKRFCHLQTHER